MVNPSLVYKHAKKWVVGEKCDKGWLNCLTMGDNKVVMSNSQKLLVIKNYPTGEPHFEAVNGTIRKNVTSGDVGKYILEELFPRVEKTIPVDDKCQYSTSISSVWFQQMKSSFEYIKKVSKKDRSLYQNACMLNFHDGKLYALSAGEHYGVKFLLANNLQELSSPWYCYFNADDMLSIIDILIDTSASMAKFSICFTRIPETMYNQNYEECDRWTGLWKMETEDLVAIGTSMRMMSKGKDEAFQKFCRSESIRPENEAFLKLEGTGLDGTGQLS